MEKYVSNTSCCMAEPMKFKDVPDYIKQINNDIDDDMDGYLIENQDNEVSWVPKSSFEDDFHLYTLDENLDLDLELRKLYKLNERLEKVEKYMNPNELMTVNEVLDLFPNYFGGSD